MDDRARRRRRRPEPRGRHVRDHLRPVDFSAVLEALKAANIETTEAEVKYLPKMQKDLDVETGKKVVRFIDALDDHDDVQNVYTDANLTEEMAAE